MTPSGMQDTRVGQDAKIALPAPAARIMALLLELDQDPKYADRQKEVIEALDGLDSVQVVWGPDGRSVEWS